MLASLRTLLIIAVFSINSGAAWAAQIDVFTDRASWSAATQPGEPITFAGLATAGMAVPFFTRSGLSIGGLTFIGSASPFSCILKGCNYSSPVTYGLAVFGWNGPVPVNDPTPGILVGPQSYAGFNSSSSLTVSGAAGTLDILLPSGTHAFATDFAQSSSQNFPAHFRLLTGTQSNSFDVLDGFVGFISNTDISEIQITQTSGYSTNQLFLANVTVDAAVPEPSMALPTLAGCFVFAFLGWLRVSPMLTAVTPKK